MSEPIENIEQLKPCPFCGAPGQYYSELTTRPMAICTNPKCDGALYEIEIWQSRPIEDALRGEIVRLREACEGGLKIAREYAAFGLDGFEEEYRQLRDVVEPPTEVKP